MARLTKRVIPSGPLPRTGKGLAIVLGLLVVAIALLAWLLLR